MLADNVHGWGILRKMDIWPRSEASWENVKSLGHNLSYTYEFTCALTQSNEPIIYYRYYIIIRTHFLSEADTGIHDIFVSFQPIRHKKKQRIISPEPLKCKTSHRTMANIVTRELIDLFDEFLSRSKFFAVDDMLLWVCLNWICRGRVLTVGVCVCVCVDLILRIFRNNCKWSKEKSRNVIALCQRAQN